MDNPLDIFKKEKDGTLVWIAAVGELHTAAALVAELFQESPGEYCVFDRRTGEMIPSQKPLQAGCGKV
jgi:3-deoxy-D-manno-octulosonic-acid transferase